MADDDIIRFEDEETTPRPASAAPWKVAVIDDDRAVHDGTRYALFDYTLNGQGLELLSAFSAEEGRALLRAHPDVAVVLLDVVMETESAGLELVGYIRDTLKNDTARIILRTGQPGQAPERDVIVRYDINDYKAKTELTADRLFTTITAALRSHQQLLRMSQTRRGLEIIIDAAGALFDFRSMQRLAEGVLTQISSLLAVECAGILVLRDQRDAAKPFSVLAASGCYRELAGLDSPERLSADVRNLIQTAFQNRRTEFSDDRSVLYIRTASGGEVVAVLEAGKTLSETDRALVEIFCSRLSLAFENVMLYDRIQRANTNLERRVQDRTRELTSANARLQAQWLRARRQTAFQGEILGAVAHDIRNPLGVILGRTEMMQEIVRRAPPPIELLETQIQHVRESAQRLTSMVSELIADARADAVDISLRRETVDLAALAKDVVEANRPLAERKGQTVRVVGAEGLTVHCDVDRMRDAIDNLVSNAIKYSRIEGEVVVETMQVGDSVALSVRDSGPGLLPEDMARLFGRFQRLSARPTGGEASTGLGLSIAKRIVDLHGGEIGAQSAGAGRGSTFTIRLPSAGATQGVTGEQA